MQSSGITIAHIYGTHESSKLKFSRQGCGLSEESRRGIRLGKLRNSSKMEKICQAFESARNSKNNATHPPNIWNINNGKIEEPFLKLFEKQHGKPGMGLSTCNPSIWEEVLGSGVKTSSWYCWDRWGIQEILSHLPSPKMERQCHGG